MNSRSLLLVAPLALSLLLAHRQKESHRAPVLVDSSSSQHWQIKPGKFTYSERYSDGSSSQSDYVFTRIYASPTRLWLAGYGFPEAKYVTVEELKDALDEALKHRAKRLLVINVGPEVPFGRVQSVLNAACGVEHNECLLPRP